jgi:hypothetical protein
MNTTSLVKHFKHLFYTCKHKYKNNKSRLHRTYYCISKVYLKQLLSFGFHLENFASKKLAKLKKFFVQAFRPLHLYVSYFSYLIFFFFFPLFSASLFFYNLNGVFIGFWEVLNPFLTSWSWEKCCKPLKRTHSGAFVYVTWKTNQFLHSGLTVKVDWVAYFRGFIGEIMTSSSPDTTRSW